MQVSLDLGSEVQLSFAFFCKVRSSSDRGRFVCTCRLVYLQTSLFDFVAMQQPGKYRCGCGVLISNVGKAEREHCRSVRHQRWLKSQQTTKTLSAFSVKEQNPVGSSSSTPPPPLAQALPCLST